MLQEIMGHASITTTLDLHGHMYPGEIDRYADRLDEIATDSEAAKCGQPTPMTRKIGKGQRAELGFRWRARRAWNPNLLIRS